VESFSIEIKCCMKVFTRTQSSVRKNFDGHGPLASKREEGTHLPFPNFSQCSLSRDGTVSVNGIWFPGWGGGENFSSPPLPDRPWGPPSFLSKGCRGLSFSADKAWGGGDVKLSTMLRMRVTKYISIPHTSTWHGTQFSTGTTLLCQVPALRHNPEDYDL
jgi:hypothetical protein